MKRQWQTLAAKTVFWLTAEIVLNLVGLDNLADYSEFVFGRVISSDPAAIAQTSSLI